MMDQGEDDVHFVERSESVINSPLPRQVTRTTSRVQAGLGFSVVNMYFHSNSSSSELEIESSSTGAQEIKNVSELNRSISGEYQRSEVSVEVDGIRETTLSTSDTVISSRIKSVYGRSSSGSTSSTDLDHKEFLDSIQAGSDSAFGVEGGVEGLSGGEGRERKTSDSYYIKQTYQIGTAESSSLSVTAIKNVTFKSSKDVEISAHSKVGPGEASQYVERVEEIIPGDHPDTLGSPEEKKHVQFAWYDTNHKELDGAEKFKSARENVQQLIENSYMVSDISSVIDNDCMGPEIQILDTESSVDVLITSDSNALNRSNQMSEISKAMESSNLSATISPSTHPSRPTDLSVLSSNRKSPDRESPPRLTYSPGIAIRSYALEELAEKKSRKTPDRLEAVVKSSRFDKESSQVDIDDGSSVDELPSGQTIPHLKKTDFSHVQSGKHNENSVRTSSTQDVGIFKLTKVQKVTLSDEHLSVSPSDQGQFRDDLDGQGNCVQETSKEEEDEMLDKLVDLESIQVGYRFHDVGMMQDIGGICNMGFDDSDESETSQQMYSTDQSMFSLPSHGTASIYMAGSSQNTYSSSESASHTLSPGSGQTWQTEGSSARSSEQSSLNLHGSDEISSIQSGLRTTQYSSELLLSQPVALGLSLDGHDNQVGVKSTNNSQESLLRETGTKEAVLSTTGSMIHLSDEGAENLTVKLEQTNLNHPDSSGIQSRSSADQSVLQTSGSLEAVLNAPGSSESETEVLQSESKKFVDNKTKELKLNKTKAAEDVKGDVETKIKATKGGKIIHDKDTSKTDTLAENVDSQLSINEIVLQEAQDISPGTIKVNAQNSNSQSLTMKTETVSVTNRAEQINHAVDKKEMPVKSSKSKNKKNKQKARAHLEKEQEATAKVVSEASHPVQVSELSLNQVSNTAENISITQVSEKEDVAKLTNNDAGNSSRIIGDESKADLSQISDKTINISGTDTNTTDNHTAAPGSKTKGKGKNKKKKGKTDAEAQHKEVVNAAVVKKEEEAPPTKTKSKHSKHKKHVDKASNSSGGSLIAAESNQKVRQVHATEQLTVSNIPLSTGSVSVQQGSSLSGNVFSFVTDEQGKLFVETEQINRVSKGSSSEQVTIEKNLGSTVNTDLGQDVSLQMSVSSEQQEKVITETEQIDRVSKVSSSEQVTINRNWGSTVNTDIGQGVSLQMSVSSEQQGQVLTEIEQRDKVNQVSSVTISSNIGHTAMTELEQSASVKATLLSKGERQVLVGTEQRAGLTKSSNEVTISSKFGSKISTDVHDGSLLQSPINNGKDSVASERSETSHQASSAVHVATGNVGLSTTTVSQNAVLLQNLENQGQLKTQDERTSVNQAQVVNQSKSILVTRTRESRPLVQVSRRFNLNNKFETSLKSQGALLKSESLTLDVYYDTPEFELTLADCWLRTHNGKWQLHANFSKLLNVKTKDEYFESEEPSIILATLKLIIQSGQQWGSSSGSIALFVQKSGLKEFVRYRTVRKTYTLTDVTVDLEMPEYGFWVGNVTASIHGGTNDALNVIYNFWRKTGVDALSLLHD